MYVGLCMWVYIYTYLTVVGYAKQAAQVEYVENHIYISI